METKMDDWEFLKLLRVCNYEEMERRWGLTREQADSKQIELERTGLTPALLGAKGANGANAQYPCSQCQDKIVDYYCEKCYNEFLWRTYRMDVGGSHHATECPTCRSIVSASELRGQ